MTMITPSPLESKNAEKRSSKLALFSWALYDWANSAFPAVIQTFVFAAYFVNSVAPNESIGSAAWGTVTGISAFIVAVLSPIFGAIADQGGGRKRWLAAFSLLCIIPTALMWYIQPSPDYMWPALWAVGIAAIGAEGAFIFYNSMLPELAPHAELGKWSGWGWAMGYAGGMMALITALFAFITSGSQWLPLDPATQEPVRATFVLVAVWFFIFALPIFIFTPPSPSSPKSFRRLAKDGFHQLGETIREIKKYRVIVKFLIAKMFYIDGLATLFSFGGIFAASVFGMPQSEILLFGIAMNLTAGIGSIAFANLDDKYGSKKVILWSLAGLTVPGIMAIMATDKLQFWIFGLLMCIFVGPVQASSRSLMARISPAHMRQQMFGFYTLSGKATAFFGPLLYGWVAYAAGSLRWGMSTIIILFLIGALIMLTLPKKLEHEI